MTKTITKLKFNERKLSNENVDHTNSFELSCKRVERKIIIEILIKFQ